MFSCLQNRLLSIDFGKIDVLENLARAIHKDANQYWEVELSYRSSF